MPKRKEKMIRKASEQDLKAIYALLLEGVSHGKVLKRSKAELKKVLKSFFVYEEGGEVVGCCSLEIYSQKLAEVRSLVVSADYRKRSLGSRLIQKCLDEACKNGIYQVVAVTDKCTLFGKFGFKTELDEKQVMFKKLTQKGER